jgi:6,7-dimethyl-8-ribityllumazine synthase
MDVQLATGVPIGFGVVTTENLAQAEERTDPKGDKGYAAAFAAATLLGITGGVPRAGFRT